MPLRFKAVLVAAFFLFFGMWLGGHPDILPSGIRDAFVDESADTTAEALQEIEDNYWRPVNTDQLQDESVRGMVGALRKQYKDRFSHYFDPEQFKQFEEATGGEFSGVGLGVNEVKGGLRVSTVFDDSPAKKAGIKEGDVITAVDGRSIAGEDADVAVGLIKGPAGTQVKLSVRSGKGDAREVTLERAQIDVPVVDGRLLHVNGKPVAYVRMVSFTPGVHAKLREEIQQLDDKGAQGLILDLRGNGGGLLTEAVLSGSVFLEDGVVVSTEGRTQGKKVYEAVGDALPPQPTVVLINGDTASAAEILTAALVENDLATSVGETTYGKGVYQQVIPLEDGGGLDLTVGEYLTSDGTSLANKGVAPDVQVKDSPDSPADEALRRARAVLGSKLGQ
jgi:carboxyl-terminal processing protease